MIRGEPVVEPGTRVARMLCAEYSSVLEQLQSASLAGLGAAAGEDPGWGEDQGCVVD